MAVPDAAADRSRSSTSPLRRVVVALDTADRELFDAWCDLFGPRVGLLKVGLEAFLRWGPGAVERAQRNGSGVFLDLKLHDIPNTVAGAVAAASDLDVRLLTVHCGGGEAMLGAAAAAAGPGLRLLGVTVLTHLAGEDLVALGLPGAAAERVASWAALAARAGCAGAVCSPHEAAELRRQRGDDFLLVTPGVRPAGVAAGDQRRVATPAAALAAGADYLVIGRPLTRAEDPEAALAALEEELVGVN